MPKGWEEAARTTGALRRSRKISTAEELLRLNLLYQTSGGSYGLTAALLQLSEDQESLNKNAVYKRIVNSAEWLKWLCENMCQQEGFLVKPPAWLEKYRVCITDASDYSKPGSNRSDMRFHYMTELFSLNMVEMQFTASSEGEKISRFKNIKANDLIIGDRAYGTVKGIAYVKAQGGEYLFRMRSKAFKLYEKHGDNLETFDLTEQLKDWGPGKMLDFSLYCKNGKEEIPIRICAIGKTESEIEKSYRQIKKSNSKNMRGKISDLQKIYSRYVVVATSLPEEISSQQILELYRMRWQIELVFKRLKSIFHGDEFAPKKDEAIKAWFYGKLLLAIICEALVKKGRFSPEQEFLL